jgi:hypothetical protein
MKRKQFLWVTTVLTLLLAAFWAGSVSASGASIASCFTDTNAPAACWMKLNGLVGGTLFGPNAAATRLQAAIWLQRVSQIPPTTGLITISDGFGNWHPFASTDNVAFTYFSSQTQITRGTAGTSYFSLQPAIPTVFYGRSLLFRGVELCYTASATLPLIYVEINTYTHTNSADDGRKLRFSDATSRTDSACRFYVLSTPVTLTAEDGVNIFIAANFTVVGEAFKLGRTTFVFAPTDVRALNPTSASVTTLQENGPQPDGLNTAAP